MEQISGQAANAKTLHYQKTDMAITAVTLKDGFLNKGSDIVIICIMRSFGPRKFLFSLEGSQGL